VTELLTARLRLRIFQPGDFEAHARISGDPEVMRYILPGPLSRVDAWWQMARYVGHWHLLGYGMWAMQDRATDEHVGRVGFLDAAGGHGFEMGWALAPAAWGRGLALEGARAALQHAFTALDRDHVVCIIHPENQRSIRVAERLGAVLEREIEDHGQTFAVYGIRRGSETGADGG
jgi:RimJ/RimL family protein N-acetyltransferase